MRQLLHSVACAMPSSSSSSSSSSNSDSDSSSEDENWAALQSVVVDAAQVHAGAQKAKEQVRDLDSTW